MTFTPSNTDKRPFYRDNYEHLADALRQLDLLIQLRVMEFRQQTQALEAQASSSQGLFIAHEFIDWLLCREETPEARPSEFTKLRQQIDALRKRDRRQSCGKC